MARWMALKLLLASLVATAGWAQATGWRGDGAGLYPAAHPPIQWDARTKANILWSTPVGKSLNGSPIVAGDKVLVTVAPAALICLDGKTGEVLWKASNTFADLDPPLQDRPVKGSAGNTVPVPVCDGERVWVVFGSGIVACYDLKGRREWIRFLDLPPAMEYGRSASPILAGGKLVVGVKHLVALDPLTGQTLWEQPKSPERYGTPAATRIGDTDVLVTPSGQIVRTDDGAILASKLADLTYATPVVRGGVAYFIGTSSVAVRLPAQMTQPLAVRKLWEQDLDGEFFASPVVDAGLIYTVSNNGVYLVLSAADGETVLEKELSIANMSGKPGVAEGHLYPSTTLIGQDLWLGNDAGEWLVLAGGREYRERARNRLPAGSGATPAVSGDRVYLRSGENLLCIGHASR